MRQDLDTNDASAVRVLRLALILDVCTPVSAQVVFFENRSPSVVDRTVVVPPERFSPDSIEELARQFLRDTARVALARLTMGTSEKSIMATMVHGSPTINTYDNTMATIRGLGLPEVPIARLIVVEGAALLSYRDKNGYSERLLAGAADPTHLRVQTTDFQLLHFRLTEPGPALRPDYYSLIVFLKASPKISIAACFALTERLRNLTRVAQLGVMVRPDEWFVGTFHFPAVFPFMKNLEPPWLLQYKSRPSADCGYAHRQEATCSGSGFLP